MGFLEYALGSEGLGRHPHLGILRIPGICWNTRTIVCHFIYRHILPPPTCTKEIAFEWLSIVQTVRLEIIERNAERLTHPQPPTLVHAC